MARTPPSDSAHPVATGADPAVPENDEGDLRRRLLRRAAVAGVLIAALLGVLAVFDSLNAPPPKKLASAPSAVVPAPEAAKPPEAAQPPEAAAPAAAPTDLAAAQPSAPAEQEMSDSPTPTPMKPERPLTKPARARDTMMRPSEPVAAKSPEPTAQLARLPHVGAPASRPLTRAAEMVRHFVLQLGVFSNTANAEELRAKLELNGIPSQIEARVRVGPFKTRREAEAARVKLRELGMEPGVLLAVKK